MCTPAPTPRAKPKAETRPFVYLLTQRYRDGHGDENRYERYHIYVGDMWVHQTHSWTFALSEAENIAKVNGLTLIKGRLK